MNNFDPEFNFNDGDWDDRGELAWNEFDWKQFLMRHESEISKYLAVYENLRDDPDRLDRSAQIMGWDTEDWSNTDAGLDDDPQPEEAAGIDDTDPYTLHRHPVYVVTHSLYRYLDRCWQAYTRQVAFAATADQAWRYARSLHAGEHNATLALQGLDMGDYALAVCHLKLALAELNTSFSVLAELPEKETPMQVAFLRQSRQRLFDLREVWLRVMRDSRDEMQRRLRGGDDS